MYIVIVDNTGSCLDMIRDKFKNWFGKNFNSSIMLQKRVLSGMKLTVGDSGKLTLRAQTKEMGVEDATQRLLLQTRKRRTEHSTKKM